MILSLKFLSLHVNITAISVSFTHSLTHSLKRCGGETGRLRANPQYICPRCQGHTQPIDGYPYQPIDDASGWCKHGCPLFCFFWDIFGARVVAANLLSVPNTQFVMLNSKN